MATIQCLKTGLEAKPNFLVRKGSKLLSMEV